MANTLSIQGSTRLSWSLSDPQSGVSFSASGETRSSRSISHGSSAGQANVALSKSITGTQAGFSVGMTGVSVSAFGGTQTVNVTTVRELLLSVATGPSGGFLTVTHPGISGVRLGVGGQFHLADYGSGITGGALSFSSTVTGTYQVDLSAAGVGTYS